MKTKTLRRLVSVLAALVMAVSLLAGCGTKTAEQVQEQEDAQTIQVYLWSTSLYETYAPYVQSQLPDVDGEFIVGNNDLDFFTNFAGERRSAGYRTCCRFSLHDAARKRQPDEPCRDQRGGRCIYNTYLQQLQKRGWQCELAAGLRRRRRPRLWSTTAAFEAIRHPPTDYELAAACQAC